MCNKYTVEISEEEKTTEAIFEAMTENFLQINTTHKTTEPGSSRTTKQDKCPKSYAGAYHIQTLEIKH